MSDPSLALQGAIVSALKNAGVTGGRVYDSVPDTPTFPYVVVGDGDVIGDDNSCGDASEIFERVHVWSRSVGLPESKSIAAQVRAALRTEFVLPGFDVVLSEYRSTRFLRDPDGLTSHAVVEFRYLIDHE